MARIGKASIAYSEKMGTKGYGSIGASCGIDIDFSEEDASNLQEEVRKAFGHCRDAVRAELDRQLQDQPKPETAEQAKPGPTVAEQQAVDSVYAAVESPGSMSKLLKEWSRAKPVGPNLAKWEPLLEEAKAFVNGKVKAGAWPNPEEAVNTIKALMAEAEYARQGALVF